MISLKLKKSKIKILKIFLLSIILVIIWIKNIYYTKIKKIPVLVNGQIELCLACHKEKVPEKVHERKILGCSSCHLGNPYTLNFKDAHKGIVKNPGDLRVVDFTCGKPECHADKIKRVKNSLMATNHGIIERLLEVFGEKELLIKYPNLKVRDLYKRENQYKKEFKESLGLSYYRKLCGSCHLWIKKGSLPYFLSERGGGCSACHVVENKDHQKNKKMHPRLTKKIPIKNCARCHSRSGRIGFTYQGLYENEQGGIGDVQWVDGRYLVKIQPDIHFSKGLLCIDCHTEEEVMGDGKFYKSLYSALEITCENCHYGNKFTKKGRILKNLKNINGKLYLKRKIDDKEIEIKPLAKFCKDKNHKRLSCSACHSHYMLDCYGCHIIYDPRRKHLDDILVKETKGLWDERETYRRLAKPTLAVRGNKIITVIPGCQDFVTILSEKGKVKREFKNLTFAQFEAHSTQKKGRTCESCHQDPKTVGLGYARIIFYGKNIKVSNLEEPFFKSPWVCLSQIVNFKGEPLVKFRPSNIRPFNKKEIIKILKVGVCLKCHKKSSKIFKNWKKNLKCPNPLPYIREGKFN